MTNNPEAKNPSVTPPEDPLVTKARDIVKAKDFTTFAEYQKALAVEVDHQHLLQAQSEDYAREQAQAWQNKLSLARSYLASLGISNPPDEMVEQQAREDENNGNMWSGWR
jgi:hypothetical protein